MPTETMTPEAIGELIAEFLYDAEEIFDQARVDDEALSGEGGFAPVSPADLLRVRRAAWKRYLALAAPPNLSERSREAARMLPLEERLVWIVCARCGRGGVTDEPARMVLHVYDETEREMGKDTGSPLPMYGWCETQR